MHTYKKNILFHVLRLVIIAYPLIIEKSVAVLHNVLPEAEKVKEAKLIER